MARGLLIPPAMRHARLLPLLATTLLSACGVAGDFGGAGDFGATPGGVKDLRYARELIARGQVPPPEALPVEGMFAEHDLGLDGPPCGELLCLRAGAAVAPTVEGAPRGWLQVGLSSSVVPDTWVRPSTTFIFTVDVSGSMSWGYGEELATPGGLARRLLHGLADGLRPDDEVAIVTYGSSVSTALPRRPSTDLAAVHAAIDRLAEDGSTDMEAGLRRAYDLGREAVAAGRQHVRVVLFTDVQPNVGATTPTAFEELTAAAAADGVELTTLALGLGIGPAVLEAMAHLRGANAFSAIDHGDVDDFLADEVPWFATPIAYDLRVAVTPAAGLTLDQPYGFPGTFATAPTLEVASVFLSKRRGALLVSLAPAGDDPAALDDLAADLALSYARPDGTTRSLALAVARAGAAADARGQWASQPVVLETTALAQLTAAMREAASLYGAAPDDAQAVMQAAHDRFVADAAALADPALDVEVELAADLLALIVARAPQGTLYGL